jgi:GNAT superfamily N-acetyltransferase
MRWRTASSDDALLLAELNHQLIEDEGHSNPMDVSALRERMLRFLETEYRAVLFLKEEKPVAYALFREDETGSIHLRQFFVLAERRREGIGRKAIQVLRDEIVPKGKRITLEVLSTNSVGRAFWNATGFTEYSVTLESKPG